MPLGRSIEATGDVATSVSARLERRDATGVAPAAGVTIVTAVGAVLVAGMDLRLAAGASVILAVAVLLVPVWLPTLREHPLALWLLVGGAAAIAWGCVLGEVNLASRAVSGPNRVQAIGLLASGFAAMVILLWARRILPLWLVVALYGAGGVTGALLEGRTDWKFALAAPVTLGAVAVLEQMSRVATIAGLLGLGVVTLLADGRAFLGFCVLTALVSAWQGRPPLGWSRRWQPAALLVVLAVVLYQLATALLAGGYLGSEAQARTSRQIEQSGSLLAGGRPEWAATVELARRSPGGFGLGAVPTWDDVRSARGGLATVGVDLERKRLAYMFGGQFRLHSVAGDLWASCGIVGLCLAGMIGFALVRNLSFSIAERAAPAAVVLAVLMACWHLLFGPIYSNWLDVCAALGFVLRPRGTSPNALDGVAE